MFKAVSAKPDFAKIERKLLDWWYKSGIVKKYLQKNDSSKKKFFFLDGPITANNPMGVHHAWGRTLKDLYQRYHNMKGERQRFQNGFDCQGLWVEVEVERELGFKSKKDIEKYGIARFVEKCKERVRKFSKIQTEQSKRLGYFMDWDDSYYTMSDENNYMIWQFLKKCWQEGNLYKGRDSVPWCPRCGTAISQHEILQEEYRELIHKSVVIKFPTKKGEYFLAWTTTPWSIPGTIGLMVHPDFDYVLVKQKDEEYILAKDRLSILKGPYKIIKEFKGKKLIGKTFRHPHQDFPSLKGQKFPVIPSEEFVTLDIGTGIVTCNPGVGHEDFLVAKNVKLEPLESIDEAANFLSGFSWLTGKNAKDNKVTERILRELKEKGFVYDIFNFTHRYPVCWRCKTELVFRMVDEWYIAMDGRNKTGAKNYRKQMMAVAKKIRWLPSWGLERELDWLKNMEDWLISKKRYWGLALPIWECSKCGHFEVVGSKEELKEQAVEGWESFEGQTPHRPWVDKVKIKCKKCKSLIKRIPDVGNPWLDAGIVSFSTLVDPKTRKVSYVTDKKYWQQWFPADLVLECLPGQFKNWFYSLLAMSTILENKSPFRTLVGHAVVRDEKGEEMHKSKGNAIEFGEASEKIGVDVMRWTFSLQPHVLNLNFGFGVADKVRRRFHLILWNVYKFFVNYASLDGFQPSRSHQPSAISHQPLDKWILTRLDQTITLVTNSLDKYDNPKAAQSIESFVQDLSTWYVRRSRERVGPSAQDKTDKNACYKTLYKALVTLSQFLAPFLPFVSEEIYKNLTGEKSIHLADWPRRGKETEDKSLLEEMAFVREVCELGHAERKKLKFRVRQPLAKLKVKSSKFKVGKNLIDLIKDELNVKKVEIKKGKGEMRVSFDTKITLELREEGEARELVRKIQEARKKAGCRLDAKVTVSLPSWPPKYEAYLRKKVLAKRLIKGKKLEIKRG